MKLRSAAPAVLLVALTCASCTAWNNFFKRPDDPRAQLVMAQEHLLDGASAVKPSQGAAMRAEAAQIQKMLDAADAGQPLDPAEVTRVVDRAYKPRY